MARSLRASKFNREEADGALDFVDLNVVVYLAQRDPEKGERAEALILASPYISVQVINEFAQVARRKMKWDWPEINEFVVYMTSLTQRAVAFG